MSLTLLEEHLVLTRKRELIEDFTRRVLAPELAGASRVLTGPSIGTRLGDMAVRVGAAVAAVLSTN